MKKSKRTGKKEIVLPELPIHKSIIRNPKKPLNTVRQRIKAHIAIKPLTEPEAQAYLRAYVYEKFDSQVAAAEKFDTSPAHLGHVLNGRKSLNRKMQKALGITRVETVTYC